MRNAVVSVVAFTVMLAACGGGGGNGGTPPPPPPVFTSLTMSATSLTLVDGDTAQLVATPRDQNGAAMTGLPAAAFTLTGAAASVSPTGRVIALDQGTATVTASLTSSGVMKMATTSVSVTALQANAAVTASAAGATFSPDTVKIAASGQVTWSFPGTAHNVIWDGPVDPPGGDIPISSNGATAARSFPDAGAYPYHCSIHGAGMSGAVIVRAP